MNRDVDFGARFLTTVVHHGVLLALAVAYLIGAILVIVDHVQCIPGSFLEHLQLLSEVRPGTEPVHARSVAKANPNYRLASAYIRHQKQRDAPFARRLFQQGNSTEHNRRLRSGNGDAT